MDETLRRISERLRTVSGLRFAAVFGSVAEGRAGTRSDLDVAASFDRGAVPGLDDLIALAADLTAVAERDIDLVALDEASTVLRWEVARWEVARSDAGPGGSSGEPS